MGTSGERDEGAYCVKILTGEQMAEWERVSIKRHKISPQTLMWNAASQVLTVIKQHPRFNNQSKIVIACGPGNNGGDGMVLASLLAKENVDVKVFVISPHRSVFDQNLLRKNIKEADFIVDAIFGLGLKRPLTGIFARVVGLLNQNRTAVKVAIDFPSGISSTTAEVLGTAFRADVTVTFEVPKWGHLLPPAWDYVGELKVLPIGLHPGELKKIRSAGTWIDSPLISSYFHPRPKNFHKGKGGSVLVLAGSKQMPGAGYLCAKAALRTGAGLVFWGVPQEAFRKIDLRYPEVILRELPSKEGKFSFDAVKEIQSMLPKFKSLAIGPGLGEGEEVMKFLQGLLKVTKKIPIVLDADGLNLLAPLLKKKKKLTSFILTPHPKEMSRLCGLPFSEVLKNRIEVAKKFAKKYSCWVILKGFRSVIASPQGDLFINSTGSTNLATAGTGDVLTGMIAALLAQGLTKKEAALSGIYLHGLAGDLLAKVHGDRGTIASDVVEQILMVVKKMVDHEI